MKNLISSKEEKIQAIEHHFAKIMETLGLDLSSPSIADTPKRVAKMYVEELFSGLDPDNFPEMRYFEPPTEKREMVIIKDIAIKSMCEHHFVPIEGRAAIAYIPNQKLLGLSKIPRLVDYFSRRPQLQERLTAQIFSALSLVLETEDIAIWIEAKHFCVTMRGVKDTASTTVTQRFGGRFEREGALAQQFLLNIRVSLECGDLSPLS